MKFIVYADLQATDGEDRSFLSPGKSLQQARVELFFERLLELSKKHRCDGIIDLGDTTDDRSAIPVPVIDTLMRGLAPFQNLRNYKIVGNHEQFVRDASVDVGRLFEGIFHVGRREIVTLADDDPLLVFLVSYPDNHDSLAKWLDLESLRHHRERKILLGHFQLAGAAMGNGTQAAMGIPRDIVERFDLTLLGHIHLPQSIGRRIHYVGSPFEQNWGEAGQAKRVGLLDTDTLRVEWLPLPGFPVHRHGSLKEFMGAFQAESEDRWKIELHSHAEAEVFYRLPESARFEAVYTYATENEAQRPENVPAPVDWGLEASLKRWTEAAPPASYGIELAPAEVVEVGRQLVE